MTTKEMSAYERNYTEEKDRVWRVIHSTWSFIWPMENNFEKAKEIVQMSIKGC